MPVLAVHVRALADLAQAALPDHVRVDSVDLVRVARQALLHPLRQVVRSAHLHVVAVADSNSIRGPRKVQ
jgi:hypothetical protein